MSWCIHTYMYCVSVCLYLFVWNLLSTETIIVLFNYPHSIIIINRVHLLQGEFFHVLWQISSNDIWCIAIIIIFTIEQGTSKRESGRDWRRLNGEENWDERNSTWMVNITNQVFVSITKTAFITQFQSYFCVRYVCTILEWRKRNNNSSNSSRQHNLWS